MRFCDQLDLYFDPVGLKDDKKCAQISVTLLGGLAYLWYASQGVTVRLSWPRLKATMLAYFKPPDYAFKARQELSSWKQRGNVTDYVMGFL